MNTIKYIEEQILLYTDSTNEKDIAHCQAYLELRKKLLDEEFINHLDEVYDKAMIQSKNMKEQNNVKHY